jgi:TPR repeat protein
MNDELRRWIAAADEGRHDEVVAWAGPRATSGEADAQFLLGHLWFTSADVDFEASRQWLRRAAAQRHAEAMYELSQMDDSEGPPLSVPPRNEEMRSLLRAAAEAGSIRAQRDLGCYLAIGQDGFVKDEAEARVWYGRAARAGHVDAQYNFGLMCLQGEGGPMDVGEAVRWLERVAAIDPPELSTIEAAELLCDVYERGNATLPADPERANAMRVRLEELRKRDG